MKIFKFKVLLNIQILGKNDSGDKDSNCSQDFQKYLFNIFDLTIFWNITRKSIVLESWIKTIQKLLFIVDELLELFI